MKLRRLFGINSNRNAGFTLMEIMLVVMIIALLSGLAIYNMTGPLDTASIVTAQTDLRALQSALTSYRSVAGSYPSTSQGLQALATKPEGEPKPVMWRAQFPDGVGKDPWKRDYVYKCPGEKSKRGFDNYCLGEDGIAGTTDDIWPQ